MDVSKSSGSLIVISGPTASGKNSVLHYLLNSHPEYSRIVTSTTRNPRPGEKNGVDYHFLERSEFERKMERGEFIEWVEYAGNLYGTSKEEFEKVLRGEDVLWVIEPSMAAKAKSVLDPEIAKKTLVIFIDVPDKETLHRRFKKRGMSEEDIEKRLAQEWEYELKWRSTFENVVINEDGKLNQTFKEVERLIHKNLLIST